ncbi:MAG: hypothetical protein DRJ32_00055 [Thermoprotei archaeon]|nr:MAG: hypothetical protein DRJ32_00055 [Thermoprotei archaeon]HDD64160.1 hypothetical protein [Thermoprotei archaeon]
MELYLFVEKGKAECSEAERLLKEAGLKYVKVDVDERNLRGWMLVDFGHAETPLLTTPDSIVVGVDNIKEYVSKLMSNPSKR